jgi:hypothetical protein
MLMGRSLAWNITARSTLLQSKETLMTGTPIEDLADAVKANPDPKLQDQGEIAPMMRARPPSPRGSPNRLAFKPRTWTTRWLIA